MSGDLPRLDPSVPVPLILSSPPSITRDIGLAALALGTGVTAWAVAQEPWQLLAATVFSGAGWAAMGAAAVNQIVSPWFIRTRPAALSMAYNGASVGGIVNSVGHACALAPHHQNIRRGKSEFRVCLPSARGEKNEARSVHCTAALGLEGLPALVARDCRMRQIVESRAPQRLVGHVESRGANDIHRNCEARREPQNGARVLRNVRLIQRKSHGDSLIV